MLKNIVRTLKYLDDLAEIAFFGILRSFHIYGPAFVALALAYYGTFNFLANMSPQAKTKDLLIERMWIDKMPETVKDQFSLYVFLDEESENGLPIGLSRTGCIVKSVFEWFEYSHCPAHVEFTWLIDGSKSKSKYSILKEKNGEFSYKMILENDPKFGNKSHVYYAFEDQESAIKKMVAFERSCLKR